MDRATVALSRGMRMTLFGKALAIAGALAAAAPAWSAEPQTVLFIGNSFTFGANSAAIRYRADSVEDLNGDGIGGVPALFKAFTEQAGLDYRVSLETSPGKALKWHWERSEEHTSELQSLMRNSYAVFCLKKKKKK